MGSLQLWSPFFRGNLRKQRKLGQSIDMLVPTIGRGDHAKMRSIYAARPETRRMGAGMAVRALRKDGSECDVEVSLSRIETDDGLFFCQRHARHHGSLDGG